MSFWDGFIGAINTRRGDELKRNREVEDQNRELESKIALKMLDDDDPEIQEHGLSILQQSMTTAKRKKGFAGFMGGLEERGGLRSLLDVARNITGQGRPGQLQEPPAQPDSAALPAASPVETDKPQGSMLQKAVQGGGAVFGAPTPGSSMGSAAPSFDEAGAATASEVPGQASFGGIDFANPGMPNPNAQVPAINVAKIASRVSQDKGQPQPGERARLFFPSAARREGQATYARASNEYAAAAAQLQALGATPNETKRALMSKMGASGGHPNISNAGYAKLADGRTVQTFHYEEAGMAPRIVMAGPDGGMIPLPGDAQATRMGATLGGSQTSRMSVKQAFEYGLIAEEDVAALGGMNQFVSVKQQGDTISILPATRPSEPFGFQRGPGFAPGVDRDGNPVNLPQQQTNPKVIAAKGLLQSLSAMPAFSRMTPELMQENFLALQQRYPILKGMTEAQVRALAQADDYVPPDQVDRILRDVNPAPPQTMAPPPGSDPNILPPDWADRITNEILKQQGQTLPPPPRQ